MSSWYKAIYDDNLHTTGITKGCLVLGAILVSGILLVAFTIFISYIIFSS